MAAKKNSLTANLPRGVLALCVLLIHAGQISAQTQRPVLDLFSSGSDEENFDVAVGAGVFEVQLATNPDVAGLVTDPDGVLDRVEVQLNGASSDTNVERIEVDEEAVPGVSRVITGQEYTFSISPPGGGPASAANFSSLLATLSYVSNLTVAALSEPPRNVTITAYDDAGASLPAVALILLREANIRGPQFSAALYTAMVAENSAIGATVIDTISASDPDGLAVRYSFQESTSVFVIDPNTAVVTVLNSTALDFETTPQFTLTVIATDEDPITPLSSESTLEISLTDENDNPPQFTQDAYSFDVVEEALNAVVGTVSAFDRDTVGTLQYDFVDITTGTTFVINRASGEINVRTTLDYEVQTVFTFSVMVSDGISTDQASVTVNVINLADNRPVVTPTASTILLNLDAGEREVFLSNGTGGPHRVEDDSTTLQRGTASIFVLRNGVVRHCRFSRRFHFPWIFKSSIFSLDRWGLFLCLITRTIGQISYKTEEKKTSSVQ